MRSYDQFVNRRHEDVRQQLLELGMSEHAITLSIPQMWFAPATTDPYSPAVIMIVEAIQHYLGLSQTGYVDAATKRALSTRVGAGWAKRPWVVVVGEVIANRKQVGAETMYQFQGAMGDEMTFPPMETSYTVKGSTCIPTTLAVRRAYIEFQKQLNRAQSALNVGPAVKIDGELGKNTLNAAHRVALAEPKELGLLRLAITCPMLARSAKAWTPKLKAVGDRAGGGGMPNIPGLPEKVAGLPLPIVAAAVGAGFIYWYKRMR